MFAFSTLAVAASLVATVVADHGHGLHARSHQHVGRSNLQKRFSGRATYYAVGLGACGQNNVPSDFIVALNTAQFGDGYPGPNCFKPITVCHEGKCVGATIMDACPTCGYGDLDLSEGLFKQFASTDAGVFQMTWTFAGDEPAPSSTKKPDPTTKKPDPEPTTSKKPDPEPITTKKPEPTTTWEEPTTTSSKRRTTTSSPPPEPTTTHEPTTSWTPTTTSSSTSTSTVVSTTTSTTSTSVAATTSTTSSSSSSAAPSALASPSSTTGSGDSNSSGSGSNLVDAQQIMIAMGRMVTAANQ